MACGGGSGTPSPAGSPPAAWPSGSPRSWTPRSARSSASRCGSPTRWATRTLVKLMTDGVLLAEIAHDRLLRQYDTIILDEAHERSLNIDFLLGYLAQLLPRRPDLKLVITSATIDVERVAAHFSGAPDRRGHRPDVPGRGPLPPGRRPRRRGRRPRPRPGQRDPRRRRRARRRGAGRHPGVPRRRAGDPRHRRTRWPSGRCRSTEIVPLYSPALGRRPAQGLRPAHRTADRAGHQRRRDVADRAGHPVRDRPGDGADLPLQPSHEGAAAADRAGQPGVGPPAVGPVRAARTGHRDPALHARPTSRAGPSSPTRRSCAPTWPRCCCRWPRSTSATSRTSRSSTRRTAARSPTASPCSRSCTRSTSDGKLTETGRALAALPLDPRHGPDGGRGRPARRARRGAGHRRRADHPGPARAPDRAPAGRRPAARPVRRRELRLPRAAEPLAVPGRAAGRAERQPVPPHREARVPALPADPGVAGPARPAARHRPTPRDDGR